MKRTKKSIYVPHTIPIDREVNTREFIEDLEEEAWKGHNTRDPNLKPNLKFEAKAIIPENFFGNDLDDIVSAYKYVSEGQDIRNGRIEFSFVPYIADVLERDGTSYKDVMYKVDMMFPIIGKSGRMFPMSGNDLLIPELGYGARDVGITDLLSPDTLQRIQDAYNMFDLSKFKYGEYEVCSIPREYMLEILNLFAGADVDIFQHKKRIKLFAPARAKSARK